MLAHPIHCETTSSKGPQSEEEFLKILADVVTTYEVEGRTNPIAVCVEVCIPNKSKCVWDGEKFSKVEEY